MLSMPLFFTTCRPKIKGENKMSYLEDIVEMEESGKPVIKTEDTPLNEIDLHPEIPDERKLLDASILQHQGNEDCLKVYIMAKELELPKQMSIAIIRAYDYKCILRERFYDVFSIDKNFEKLKVVKPWEYTGQLYTDNLKVLKKAQRLNIFDRFWVLQTDSTSKGGLNNPCIIGEKFSAFDERRTSTYSGSYDSDIGCRYHSFFGRDTLIFKIT